MTELIYNEQCSENSDQKSFSIYLAEKEENWIIIEYFSGPKLIELFGDDDLEVITTISKNCQFKFVQILLANVLNSSKLLTIKDIKSIIQDNNLGLAKHVW